MEAFGPPDLPFNLLFRRQWPMSEKSKARTLRRKNQQDKKKFNNCFLTEDQIREKDMKDLFLNPQRKRLEHKPK
jgi:hypothetical protein